MIILRKLNLWGDEMNKLDRVALRLVRGLDFVSCMLLLGMLCFIVIYVILRAVFAYSIFGTYELVQYCCLIVVACALAANDYKDGHIKVTVLTEVLGPKARKVMLTISMLLSMAMTSIAIYGLVNYAINKRIANSITQNLEFPVWIFITILCVAFLLLLVSETCRLIFMWNDYKNVAMIEDEADTVSKV